MQPWKQARFQSVLVTTSVTLHLSTFLGIHRVLTSDALYLLKMVPIWNIYLPSQTPLSINMRRISQSGHTLWSPIGQQAGP